MLLDVKAQREAIQAQMRLLSKVIYKLNNQMRHFKELHQLPMILRFTLRHLITLKRVQNLKVDALGELDLSGYLQESQRIKNYIIRKGQQMRQLLKNAVFMSFTVIGLGCLAKLKFNLDKIENKLRALDRIATQIKKKQKARQIGSKKQTQVSQV